MEFIKENWPVIAPYALLGVQYLVRLLPTKRQDELGKLGKFIHLVFESTNKKS